MTSLRCFLTVYNVFSINSKSFNWSQKESEMWPLNQQRNAILSLILFFCAIFQAFYLGNYFMLLRGGLMVSALDSGARALGSSPGRGHCVVFLGKTLYSRGASLHPGV